MFVRYYHHPFYCHFFKQYKTSQVVFIFLLCIFVAVKTLPYMKRIFLLSYVLLGMTYFLPAQTIHYPEEIKTIYKQADQEAILTHSPRPIIGIPETSNSMIETLNIRKAGGNPIVIPHTTNAGSLRELAAHLDGLVIMQDINAADTFSILLYKTATDRNIPILVKEDNQLMAKIDSGTWRIHTYSHSYPDLIQQAGVYKHAKNLHSRIFTLDTHSDLPGQLKHGYSISKRKTNQVSIQKMEEGMLDAEYITDFQTQGAIDEEGLKKGEEKGKRILQQIYDEIKKYSDFCGIAKNPEEAYLLKAQGKKAFFIGMENGHGLGGDLKNIKWYADRGVTYITLCWMKDNAICHSSSIRNKENKTNLGLTPWGRKVVKEMNKQGVIIDVSHTSEQTFWDCIKLSKAPIVCSHSGCMSQFKHDRNLTDEQIKALAKKGGVVQIYAVWNYQSSDERKVNINTMIEDIDHAVKIAGINHVGIGIDLDGGGGYTGIMAQNDAINITIHLIKKGYSDEDISKLWGKNFLRVMKTVQQFKGNK